MGLCKESECKVARCQVEHGLDFSCVFQRSSHNFSAAETHAKGLSSPFFSRLFLFSSEISGRLQQHNQVFLSKPSFAASAARCRLSAGFSQPARSAGAQPSDASVRSDARSPAQNTGVTAHFSGRRETEAPQMKK